MIEFDKVPAHRVMAVATQAPKRTVVGIFVNMTVDAVRIQRSEREGIMALGAGNRPVQANERKARQVMVERQVLRKTFLTVAIVALQQHGIVRIICFVATPAVVGQRVRQGSDMTVAADQIFMPSLKSKTGNIEVLELCLPGRLTMAVLTGRTVPTQVHVIAAVAARAVFGQRYG